MQTFDPQKVPQFPNVALYHWSALRSARKSAFNDPLFWTILDVIEAFDWHVCSYLNWDVGKPMYPFLRELVRDGRKGEFQMVLCWNLTCFPDKVARKVLSAFEELNHVGVQCLTLSGPFANLAVQDLTLSQLRELIKKDGYDPKYLNEIVTIRLAERERQCALAKRSADKRRERGKSLGRPATKRAEILRLLTDGKSPAEIMRILGGSRASVYRAYDIFRKPKKK